MSVLRHSLVSVLAAPLAVLVPGQIVFAAGPVPPDLLTRLEVRAPRPSAMDRLGTCAAEARGTGKASHGCALHPGEVAAISPDGRRLAVVWDGPKDDDGVPLPELVTVPLGPGKPVSRVTTVVPGEDQRSLHRKLWAALEALRHDGWLPSPAPIVATSPCSLSDARPLVKLGGAMAELLVWAHVKGMRVTVHGRAGRTTLAMSNAALMDGYADDAGGPLTIESVALSPDGRYLFVIASLMVLHGAPDPLFGFVVMLPRGAAARAAREQPRPDLSEGPDDEPPAQALARFRAACRAGSANGCFEVRDADGASPAEAQRAQRRAEAIQRVECGW